MCSARHNITYRYSIQSYFLTNDTRYSYRSNHAHHFHILAIRVACSNDFEAVCTEQRLPLHALVTYDLLDQPYCFGCVGLVKEQHCVHMGEGLSVRKSQLTCLVHFPDDVFFSCPTVDL